MLTSILPQFDKSNTAFSICRDIFPCRALSMEQAPRVFLPNDEVKHGSRLTLARLALLGTELTGNTQ